MLLLGSGAGAVANAGASSLSKLIGNEVIGATTKELTNKAASGLAKNIAVNATNSLTKIPVENITERQFRGVSAGSLAELLDIVKKSQTETPHTVTGGQAYGNGMYFFNNPEDAQDWAIRHQPGDYKAVLSIKRPSGSYIDRATFSKNMSDFKKTLDVPGDKVNEIADAAFEEYMRKNGVSGIVANNYEGRNPVYVLKNKDLVKDINLESVYTPDNKKWNSDLGSLLPSTSKKTGGFSGHKGRPGKRGGSLPRNIINPDGTGHIDLSNINKYMAKPNTPKIVYHGSPTTGIEDFDLNMAGKNTQSGERAIYFTDDYPTAEDFSYERLPSNSMFENKRGKKGEVYTRQLSLKNPLDLDNLTDEQIDELYNYIDPRIAQLTDRNKFIKTLQEARKAKNGQMVKSQLDLNKLAGSGYDGFVASMYPGENNVKEYGVFDTSAISKIPNTKMSAAKRKR